MKMQSDYDYTTETLLKNIAVLSEEYEMLSKISWDVEKLNAAEIAERQERLKAILATFNVMTSLVNGGASSEELQECLKTQRLLENEIKKLRSSLKSTKPTPVQAPVDKVPRSLPRPASGPVPGSMQSASDLAKLSKKQLNDLVKQNTQNSGRSLKELNEILKLRFDKTLSKLTKPELQEILVENIV